jgi:hypothetical protein
MIIKYHEFSRTLGHTVIINLSHKIYCPCLSMWGEDEKYNKYKKRNTRGKLQNKSSLMDSRFIRRCTPNTWACFSDAISKPQAQGIDCTHHIARSTHIGMHRTVRGTVEFLPSRIQNFIYFLY